MGSPLGARTLSAAALGLAALLAVVGLRTLAPGDDAAAAPVAMAPAATGPLATRPAAPALPRRGDCGHHQGARVVPVLCDDPAADVEVAGVHLGGDPGQRCPLYRPDAVLFTSVTQELFVCWVPRGGGPRRSFEGPAPEVTVVTVPAVTVGMCGLIHDDHVHHPLDCVDPTVNAVAARVFPADQRGSCPSGTAREEALPDGARVCWSDA